MPWIADGVDDSELETAEELITAARSYSDVFNALLEMPWVQDSITTDEAVAIHGIRRSARHHLELSEGMLRKPWVQDGITRDEAIIIDRLYELGRAEIVDMPFLDEVTFGEKQAVDTLANMAGWSHDVFPTIMSHPKVQDGITDQEAKVITILHTPALREPEMIPYLLDGLDGTNGVYVEERIIQLPLTGETLLAIIRTENRTTASMDYLEHAVRFNEEFMAAPLPTNYVTVYFGPNTRGTYAAHNWYTHMAMGADRDGREEKANVFAHEVGHYYFRGPGPRWIHEGAPEIIAFVSEYERAGSPLETYLNPPCEDITTLPASNPDEHKRCAYFLGGSFFIDLYRALGEDAFLRGFRALHRLRLGDNIECRDSRECTILDVNHVEAAFKDGASDEVIHKVDEVLAYWYYGKTTETVISGLENGESLERNRRTKAAQLLKLSWIADGVDDSEREAAEELIRAALWEPDVFDALIEMPWLQGTPTTDEAHAIYDIRGLDWHSPLLSERILQKSWVQDDITRDEAIIIRRLYWLAGTEDETTQQKMVDVALSIIDMPFLDDVTFAEARAMMSLHSMSHRRHQDIFRAIMSHPNVQDGITDQEANVIAVLETPAYHEPEVVPDLLDGLDGTGGVYLEERIIQLPLTGETLLTIVRTEDQVTASMDYLEYAVRFNEKFMAAPLPTNYVALYFGPNAGQSYTAHNWYTHMAMQQSDDGIEEYASTIAREVGHYFFKGSVSAWINEGTVDLISFVSEYERAGYPYETHMKDRSCDSSVKTLPESGPDEHYGCARNLGERFWLDMYLTLGEEAFLQGFRTLYRMRLGDNPYCDYTWECTELNVNHVLEAFTTNVPEEDASKFKEIMVKWYGYLPSQ